MRRLAVLTLALFLLLPDPAFAHGLGQTYAPLTPFWLYFFAAVTAVLISFVQVGLFVGEADAVVQYPRFDLLRVGFPRALLAARPFLFVLRLLSVALFLLVILSGLLGQQVPNLMVFYTVFSLWILSQPSG